MNIFIDYNIKLKSTKKKIFPYFKFNHFYEVDEHKTICGNVSLEQEEYYFLLKPCSRQNNDQNVKFGQLKLVIVILRNTNTCFFYRQWLKTIDVKTLSFVLLSFRNLFVPFLKEKKYGFLINCSIFIMTCIS